MISVPHKLRTARERAGLTQGQLAAAARVGQAQISLYERGIVKPQDEVVARILRAARPSPAALILRHADRILDLAEHFAITAVRATEPDATGDVSLIVTPGDSSTSYSLGAFAVEVEDLLDHPITVLNTAEPLGPDAAKRVADSRPLLRAPRNSA